MTNEEAIARIEEHKIIHKMNEPRAIYISEALDMAIKALEQQPNRDKNPCETCGYVEGSPFCLQYCPYDAERKKEQQPCEDVISREAVIEWLKAKDIIKLSSQEETARKELKVLSPVTPQKYGKWIDYSDEGFVECPFCGHATNCEDNINELHYCFHCGAKMQESEEV